MKKALILASVLPLIITAISMFYLPDTVAFHFGANGEPDAWGSKPTLFVGAGIAVACNLIMIGMYLLDEKQKRTGVEYLVLNNPIPLWLCWVILVILDALAVLPILFNLGLVGTIAFGPALTIVFILFAIIAFVIGVQLLRGKGLDRVNLEASDSDTVKDGGYWQRAGKAIGVFLILIAIVLVALAFVL